MRGVGRDRKKVQTVLNILDRELKFFLRWFHISEKMKRDEEHQNKREVISEFRQLRRFELREQLVASVNKLKDAVRNIIGYYPNKIQLEIEKHVQNMERLEGRVLIDTANKLKEELKKQPINWVEVKRVTDEIIHFLRALAYVDRETKKLVEG